MTRKEYLRTLELAEDSSPSQEEIKREYKRLALEWHPDRLNQPLHSAGGSKDVAEREMKKLNEAYINAFFKERSIYWTLRKEIFFDYIKI